MEAQIALLLVDGPARRALDLRDDFSVSLEWVSPLAEERQAFSYDFDLPATPRNLRLLGNPDLAPRDWEALRWECEFAGSPLPLRGQLRCAGYDGRRLTMSFTQEPGFWQTAAVTPVDGMKLPCPNVRQGGHFRDLFEEGGGCVRCVAIAEATQPNDYGVRTLRMLVRVEAFLLLKHLVARVGYTLDLRGGDLPESKTYVLPSDPWFAVYINKEGDILAWHEEAEAQGTGRMVSTLLRDLCLCLGVRLAVDDAARRVTILHFMGREPAVSDHSKRLGPMGYSVRPEIAVPKATPIPKPLPEAMGKGNLTTSGKLSGMVTAFVERVYYRQKPPYEEANGTLHCWQPVLLPGMHPEGLVMEPLRYGAEPTEPITLQAYQLMVKNGSGYEYDSTHVEREARAYAASLPELGAAEPNGENKHTVRYHSSPYPHPETPTLRVGQDVWDSEVIDRQSVRQLRWVYRGALAVAQRYATVARGGQSAPLRLREEEHGFACGRAEFCPPPARTWHYYRRQLAFIHHFKISGVPPVIWGEGISTESVLIDGAKIAPPNAQTLNDTGGWVTIQKPAPYLGAELRVRHALGTWLPWGDAYCARLRVDADPHALCIRSFSRAGDSQEYALSTFQAVDDVTTNRHAEHRKATYVSVKDVTKPNGVYITKYKVDKDAYSRELYQDAYVAPKRESKPLRPRIYSQVGQPLEASYDAYLADWVLAWACALEGELLRWDEEAVLRAMHESPMDRMQPHAQCPLRISLTLSPHAVRVERVRVILWEATDGAALQTAGRQLAGATG